MLAKSMSFHPSELSETAPSGPSLDEAEARAAAEVLRHQGTVLSEASFSAWKSLVGWMYASTMTVNAGGIYAVAQQSQPNYANGLALISFVFGVVFALASGLAILWHLWSLARNASEIAATSVESIAQEISRPEGHDRIFGLIYRSMRTPIFFGSASVASFVLGIASEVASRLIL